jgi:hypothetical protein
VGKDSYLLGLAIVAAPFHLLHSAKMSLNWWPYLRLPAKVISAMATKFVHKIKHKLELFLMKLKQKELI